ncbi:MAG: cbb3-type cytochrome c oxidase subunit I [Thermodesulfovibrionia bacterium]|nr:cbb3-type cytochrome c oxidase subunit I [Thermodesulfovibrionia bacterium]MCK5512828.1 cbb3-type cytochrome c oxidase subunit I [Thermodesulfovibrionia bacterium]
MERIIVWYLRMSVIYFATGVMFGMIMLLWPDSSGYYRPVHVHLNLLGFMSMMIYGVGYHILPRFSGEPVYSPLLTRIQFWFANAGLLGMAVSWPFVVSETNAELFNPILIISAFLSLAAIIFFTINILKTIKPAS